MGEVKGVFVCDWVCVLEVVQGGPGDFIGTGQGAGLLVDVFGSTLSTVSGA